MPLPDTRPARWLQDRDTLQRPPVAGTTTTTSAPTPAPEPSKAPEWFTAFEAAQSAKLEALEGRMTLFGKDLGRLRGKVKQVRGDEGNSSAAEEPEQPTEKGTQPGPAAVTRDDILAARRLGVLQASLPQELQEHLDQMVEDGKSFVQVTEIAEAYARAYGLQTPETPPANGGIKRPTGRAASAAPTEEPRHPTTLTELRVLKERDRAAYDRLMHPDSAFDPTKLARR